jgi:hypothetical protein
MYPVVGLLVALVAALAWPAPSYAQRDSLGLHTTLNRWADEAWFTIIDRDASIGGRLSDQGILQRFQPRIGPDYEGAKIRYRFDALDDYYWYRRTNGARFAGGSVTTRDMAIDAEFKQSVPLGSRWSADVHFNKENLPDVVRNLVRLGFTRTEPNGAFAFIEGALTPVKPSADIEVGAGWRRGYTRAAISVAVLDAFNDLIYQSLHVYKAFADTALDYERHPIMLHANLDLPLASHFRFEGHGGLLGPSVVKAYVQEVPDSGFRQDEDYGFAGALVEWIASPRVTAGAFGTYVNAVTDRQPLPYGRPLDDFQLTERTTKAGAQLLARLAPRWLFQSWAGRMWRTEQRVYRTSAAPDVDYKDVSWSGQAELKYGARDGLMLSTALDVDDRQVVRGDGEVPSFGTLTRNNNRLRFDFGWRFPTRSEFTLGLAFDLDPGHYTRGWFGGAHGRWVLCW